MQFKKKESKFKCLKTNNTSGDSLEIFAKTRPKQRLRRRKQSTTTTTSAEMTIYTPFSKN